MSLKSNFNEKFLLSKEQLNLLMEISGSKIVSKNSYSENINDIENLLNLGVENATVYLERSRLGQKLSLFDENNLYKAVVELEKTLSLNKTPRRIECYDISHLSGTHVYGSMITFIDGRAISKFYRLFKCKNQNDDFENHRQVMTRRFQKFIDNPGVEGWNLPDLIIVDGGKGQLSSDLQVLANFRNLYPGRFDKLEMISLAKKEEEIFTDPNKLYPPNESQANLKYGSQGGILVSGQAKFLLQRIRDEAHRFAITNNRKSRLKDATKSTLDKLPGVGTVTRQKILNSFGSSENFTNNLLNNPDLVAELIGYKQMKKLREHFKFD